MIHEKLPSVLLLSLDSLVAAGRYFPFTMGLIPGSKLQIPVSTSTAHQYLI